MSYFNKDFSRNERSPNSKFNQIKYRSRANTKFYGTNNFQVIFNDGTPIDWMIAKKKLKRKFKSVDCWDIVINDSEVTDKNQIPLTYKEYYKIELFKVRDQLIEAKSKIQTKNSSQD